MAKSEGCGRLRWSATSKSPLVVTSEMLLNRSRRGFFRNLSWALSCNRSKVHLTSLAVNGLPSCQLTPSRSLNVTGLRCDSLPSLQLGITIALYERLQG